MSTEPEEREEGQNLTQALVQAVNVLNMELGSVKTRMDRVESAFDRLDGRLARMEAEIARLRDPR